MLEALQALKKAYPFTIDVVDVDADEALTAQYDELVPVLVANNGTGAATRLCHYFMDQKKVRDFLQNDIIP